jgi:hypothetical protein
MKMDNFVIWVPDHDGHAPPFWQDGMRWNTLETAHISPSTSSCAPLWLEGVLYVVPAKPVTPPFDPEAWLEQGHANLEKLPAGVVLPEPKDWADKLVKEWQETPLCEALGLADFIRTHCQPREVPNAPDLLEVANKAFDFLGGVDGAAEIRAELLSAIAKATKP